MTGDGGIKGRWSDDLPDDLLGAIYGRCSSSSNRARFTAVCRSWRAAASWQPKLPSLPLLLPSTGNSCLDKKARAYSPEDGRVLRSRLPWFPYGKRIVGSHDGGWVAAAICGRIEIVNLFTRAQGLEKGHIACRCPHARRNTGQVSIKKVVFSDDPTSEGCILAAMTTRCTIAVCRLGCPGGAWATYGCGTQTSFLDIAFCNGDLYGLSDGHRLCKVVIGINEYDAQLVISLENLSVEKPNLFYVVYPKYIFQLGGKLATAVKVSHIRSKARTFKVFELASSDTTQAYKYTWAEVTSLDDHVLFLGPGCCKAVQVSVMGMHGQMEGNHIYYTKQKHRLPNGVDPECLDRLDLGSLIVYCYDNKGAHHPERIKSQGYHYREKRNRINGGNSCTWIFPPHF
jgi:hypothetical protein